MAQIRFAISTPTPSLGKNSSGGLSAQLPRAIHWLSILILSRLRPQEFRRLRKVIRSRNPREIWLADPGGGLAPTPEQDEMSVVATGADLVNPSDRRSPATPGPRQLS